MRKRKMQEIFDRTVKHLAEQSGPALTRTEKEDGCVTIKCAYRADGGRKCAVGYWLIDEEYWSGIEGKAIAFPEGFMCWDLITGESQQAIDGNFYKFEPNLKSKFSPEIHPFPGLMRDLQKAHDEAWYLDDKWSDFAERGSITQRLRQVASIYGLFSASVDLHFKDKETTA